MQRHISLGITLAVGFNHFNLFILKDVPLAYEKVSSPFGFLFPSPLAIAYAYYCEIVLSVQGR